ncbi:Lysophosphatidylcholine acyltransferase [Nymphon striatum]|nr:Lysophosphatidylcholine acyltransferase [Nymphon striatum]
MDGSTSILNEANEIINPFIHRIEFTPLERIKVAILSVTAAPIRALALFVTLTATWMIAVGGLIGRYDEDLRKKPLSKLHRGFLKPILCQMLRLMFMFGGWHWITVKGKRASSKEAPILAIAPHSSFFDAIVMSFLGAPSIVAKAEIDNTPFFGSEKLTLMLLLCSYFLAITKYCEPIYVSRDDPNSRQNTVQEIIKRSSNAEYEGNQIGIFPEGTCTNRTCLITFKPDKFFTLNTKFV